MKDSSLYVPVHADLWEHPKLRRLARRLGIDDVTAVGHLVALWTWCVRYAPDGVVADLSDEEIEDAARWGGDSSEFASLLRALEWIVDGRINDWEHYAGEGLAMRTKWREQKRAQRDRERVSADSPSDVRSDRDRDRDRDQERDREGAPAPQPTEQVNRARMNPNAPPPVPGRVLTDEDLQAIRRKNGVGAGRGFMENPADFPQTPEALAAQHRAELVREFPWLDGRAGRQKLDDAVATVWPGYVKRRRAVNGGHANAWAAAKGWMRSNTGEDRRAFERERAYEKTTTTESAAASTTKATVLKPLEGPHPLEDPATAAEAAKALEAMGRIGKAKPRGKP